MFISFSGTLPEALLQARQHDAARAQAAQLRDEAIDDFWRGADVALQRSLHEGPALVARSALRLQARLARHRLARQTGQLEG